MEHSGYQEVRMAEKAGKPERIESDLVHIAPGIGITDGKQALAAPGRQSPDGADGRILKPGAIDEDVTRRPWGLGLLSSFSYPRERRVIFSEYACR